MYADLSHPTAAGYALLAERLMAEEAFHNFVGSQAWHVMVYKLLFHVPHASLSRPCLTYDS